jgi:DNA-binding LytR/AlgR family response regulator
MRTTAPHRKNTENYFTHCPTANMLWRGLTSMPLITCSSQSALNRFLKSINKILQVNLQSNTTITTATENHPETAQPFFYLRVDSKMVKVLFNDILYIEGLRDYIRIFTTSKTIVTKHLLATLEETLPSDAFLRIHRSYIVSISKIPIGRLYKHDVSKLLNASSLRPIANINLKNKSGTD